MTCALRLLSNKIGWSESSFVNEVASSQCASIAPQSLMSMRYDIKHTLTCVMYSSCVSVTRSMGSLEPGDKMDECLFVCTHA